ncbi:MAG: hypothetical protein IKW90_13725 [Lachnospiraceae bacterium]|nr:hypothetical protein [Lachnospiraceae bacterium]
MRDVDLLISIENSAEYVASKMGKEEVAWILSKYDADSIEELNPSDYENVFGELFQREVDLKSD